MIFFQRIQMGGGGVWGLELVNFFSKNPNLKKEKIFFFGGGGGAGGGGRGRGVGALEEVKFFYKESKFKTFFLAGGEGLGDWEARVRDFFY